MKKIIKLILPITIILFIIFFIIINMNSITLNINPEDVSSITVTSLPSPPKEITLTDKNEIKDLISELNNLDLKKTNNSNEKGWIHLINITGVINYEIQILSNRIKINSACYKFDDISQLSSLLESIQENNS